MPAASGGHAKGRRAPTNAWRLSGLDDIPLFAGPVREVTALIARDQRLLRLPLTLPEPATTWRLAPRKDQPAPSPWPGG